MDDYFEQFWQAYPRRVGKGAARTVWQRLRPNGYLLADILDALTWQSKTEQWRKDRGQFIPHPATWLRQERWLDEPIQTDAAIPDCPHYPRCAAPGRSQCQLKTALAEAKR